MTTFTPGNQGDGTWILPTHRVGQLSHRVEVLNRRVKKTGGSGVSLAPVREFVLEVEDPDCPDGPRIPQRWSVLRVDGAVPVVAGWSFVARVEHHDGLGNIIAKAPSCYELGLPPDLRTAGATCDHCNAHRNRKDTFVLRDCSGVLRRVGRNCLQDFLRGADPEAALRLWSLLSAVESLLQGASDEGYEGGGGGVRSFDTVRFLAATASAIRNEGWVSKAQAQGGMRQATAALAAWLCDRAPRDERAREEWLRMQPTEADFEEAGEVVAWVEGLEQLNDYLHNLRVAVLLRHVERKHEGIVASGVMARRRDLERAALARLEAERTKELPPSAHVGAVGLRLDLHRVTVRSVRPVSTSYGPSNIVTAQDEAGNDVKWFANAKCDLKAGDLLRGHGTVREHGSYRGRAETVLSRAKFERVPPGSEDSVAFGTQRTLSTESDSEVPF